MDAREVSRVLQISDSMLSRIKTGGRVPGRANMLKIQEVWGWSMADQTRAATAGTYAAEFDRLVLNAEPIGATK